MKINKKNTFSSIYNEIINDSSYDKFINKFKLDEQLNELLKKDNENSNSNKNKNEENSGIIKKSREDKNKNYINVNLSFEDEELYKILNEFNTLLTDESIFSNPKKPPTIDCLFPHLKKLDNLNITASNKIEQTNTLEFVQNYEFQNYRNNNLYNKDLLFLSNYYHSTDFKYKIFEKKKLKSFSERIEKEKITCAKVRNGIIYIGCKDGSIKTFSEEKGYKDKTYIYNYDQKYKDLDKDVMCISFYEEDKYFLVGYATSFIILWEKTTVQTKKIITKTHDLPVIACKVLKYNQKELSILSSDLEGKIRITSFSSGFLFTKEDIIIVSDNFYPSFLLETLNFSSEEENNYESKLIYNKEKFTFDIAIIGNIEKIEVKKINKENYTNKNLLIIKNPDFNILDSKKQQKNIEYFENADISIGCGYLPDIYEEGDLNNHILLAVSWKDDISIYSMSDSNKLINPEKVGFYKNDNIIIRIGFITKSILFFIDRENKLKFINTRHFNIEMEITNVDYIFRNRITPSYSETSEIDDEIYINKNGIFEGNSLYINSIFYHQNYIYILIWENKKSRRNGESSINYSRQNSIFSNQNTLIISLNNSNENLPLAILQIKLLSWKEALDNTSNNGDWMNFFCIFKEILNQKIFTYSNIPFNTQKRTKLLIDNGKICGNYIYKYIIDKIHENDDIGDDEILSSIQDQIKFNNNNNNFMSIIIEFCISLHTVNYLFEIIKEIESKEKVNLLNLFIKNLEPFIIKNKLRIEILSQNFLNEILNYYSKKEIESNSHKMYNLSLIIYHLNIDCLKNNNKVKEICDNCHFFNAIIYIYNCGFVNFIYPFEQLFKFFLVAKELKFEDKNNLSSTNFYNNDLIKSYEKETFELSKEYIGHKLLWYINLCLEGKLYPTFEKIPPEQYNLIIPQIFKCIIKYEVIIELIKFDSFTFFKVFKNFFTEERSFNLLMSIPKNEITDIIEKYINIPSSNIKIQSEKYFIFNKLIYQIMGICELIENKIIKYDEHLFIIRISKIIDINLDLLFDSLNFVLCFNQEKKNLEDKFNCHLQLLYKDDEYFLKLGNELIDFINYLIEKSESNENNNIKTKFLPILRASALQSPFLLIKIHLLKLNDDYKRCIDVYLNQKNIYKYNVFEFIHKNLSYLYKESTELFIQLKNYVKEKLSDLSEISVKEISKLINKWYFNDKEDIINYLDKVPNIQLFYLENIIKEYKEDETEMKENSYIKEKYWKLVYLYLKLLIKFDRRQQVLKTLKENSPFINIEMCLKLCLENQLTDSSIYLYQLLGEGTNALNIAINQIEYCYTKIKRNKGTDINLHYILLGDLKKIISDGTKICENSYNFIGNNKLQIEEDPKNQLILEKMMEQKNLDSDDEDEKKEVNEIYECWLLLLNKLYAILQEIKSQVQNEYYISLNEFFSIEIETFLKKMCFYVDIKTILDNITSNYQEAEFKELKGILTRIISVNARLYGFYQSFIHLLSNNIYYEQQKFSKMKVKGTPIRKYICDFCKIEFKESDNDDITVFNCGHVFHFSCLPLSKEKSCIICKKEEIELSIIREEEKQLSEEEITEINKNIERIKTENQERYKFKQTRIKIINEKKIMNKLDQFNKEFFEY